MFSHHVLTVVNKSQMKHWVWRRGLVGGAGAGGGYLKEGYSIGCSLKPHRWMPLNPTQWSFKSLAQNLICSKNCCHFTEGNT